MHLCTFATLCFFKITFPRIYYYCNQDDTIPWVCVLKYVSNSNCCHRHLKLYISMFKSFHTYRKYIYQQSSGNFLVHPDTFRSSRNFPVHPDTLHINWIFCVAKYPEIPQPIMNLSQKLSGFAKTFRSALLTRWRGFCDSAPAPHHLPQHCAGRHSSGEEGQYRCGRLTIW